MGKKKTEEDQDNQDNNEEIRRLLTRNYLILYTIKTKATPLTTLNFNVTYPIV